MEDWIWKAGVTRGSTLHLSPCTATTRLQAASARVADLVDLAACSHSPDGFPFSAAAPFGTRTTLCTAEFEPFSHCSPFTFAGPPLPPTFRGGSPGRAPTAVGAMNTPLPSVPRYRQPALAEGSNGSSLRRSPDPIATTHRVGESKTVETRPEQPLPLAFCGAVQPRVAASVRPGPASANRAS